MKTLINSTYLKMNLSIILSVISLAFALPLLSNTSGEDISRPKIEEPIVETFGGGKGNPET